MICSVSVQTTNILFPRLESKGAWLRGQFIRHTVCFVGENGAVWGVQRCLSILQEMGISCFFCIIWLQAVDGTPWKQCLDSTFPGAMIYCIRQNGFDFGCLLLKFYVGAGFFLLLCHRSRFMARERNKICLDVSSGLLSCFSSAGWDLEINSFRKSYLNILLIRGKMRDQVGYVWVEHWKNNLRVVSDPENLRGKDGRILVWKGSHEIL